MEYQLLHYDDIQLEEMLEEHLAIIADLEIKASRWNPNLKIANVVQNKMLKAVLKQYKIEMDESPWQVEIFETQKEALKWCEPT